MSLPTLLLADWNATPRDRGRWSPDWIAHQAGLRIHSAGPGRHGDIDYGLADCDVHRVQRHDPPSGASRSDHDVVTMTVESGPRQLRVGTWNVRYGRDPRVVKSQVALALSDHHLDVLCLQEAADYHHQLEAIAGYRLVAFPQEGRWHQVVLVRDTLPIRRPRPVRLSPRGWRLVAGGRHSELWGIALVVDSWLRVMDLHMPPTVNWRSGVIFGPPMRVAAYAAAAGKLVRWTRRHRRHQLP